MTHFPEVVAELKECNRLLKENNELLRFLLKQTAKTDGYVEVTAEMMEDDRTPTDAECRNVYDIPTQQGEP